MVYMFATELERRVTLTDPTVVGDAASAIPTGTVTFLFTDIEGSTRLLERLRQEYADLLADQRRLLRAAFEEWNGFEVDTQGDSFFVAFPRAIDALQCTVAAQRAIAAHHWPQGVQLRVRMALHTGEPIVQRTGYVGMDVHRAARIGAAAHGGQILVSGSTRELLAADMPTGIDFLPLGSHRLKDVRQPVELYQVRAAGLPTDFPPLRTVSTGDEPPTPGEPPFKGLEFFDESDARLFFGREKLTAELVERLDSATFLAVVGASGSGKSSLVRAGVVPAIREQEDTDWTIRTFTPTAHPLEALALALTSEDGATGKSGSPRETAMLMDDLAAERRTLHLFARGRLGAGRKRRRVLLVVDQFEELFTLARDEAERASFLDNLLSAVGDDGLVSVLLTLRADFYGRLATNDRLRTAVAEDQEYIGPMSPEELRRAIEAPAEAGGWEFSPGLVDLILHDVGEEPGALPLLSHALLETWRRRRGNVMTLKAYAESGGVRGAIARTADRVFHAELDPAQQEIAQSIFLRLTELGEGNQDTRRRVALRELVPAVGADGEAVSAVLARLVEARLVTTSADTAEVAHEALIREWPTLREWLSRDREALRVHRHLTEAVQEWELLERDPGALYRGARLANAIEWARDHPQALNPQERAFLDASEEQLTREDDEREEQRRREIQAAEQLAASEAAATRRLRRRAVMLTGVLVVAVAMAGIAIVLGLQGQQSAADAKRNFAKAESQRLAGESSTLLQLQGSSELAALLALRGLSADYSPQADMSLQRASRLDFGRSLLLSGLQVDSLAVSPDGAHVITMARDGIARLWNVATGDLVRQVQVGGTFSTSIRFSPDGTRFAVSAAEGVSVWDVASGARVATAQAGTDAVFSPDGRQLFVGHGDHVDVVDIDSGSVARSMKMAGQSVGIFPDGRHLVSSAGAEAYITDALTGAVVQTLSGHKGNIAHVAVSHDGRYVATSSWDKTAKVWDAMTGRLVQTMVGHSEILFGLAFSPDDRSLLTGSLDNTARLWDIATGQQIRRFNGHTGGVYAVDFTPDGRYAITGSADRSARIWDLASPLEADTLAGQTSFVYAVAFSPDGSKIFTGSGDGTGMLWDAASRQIIARLYSGSRVDAAAFSPDGRYLLVAHSDRPAELWDVATASLVRELAGSAAGNSASFSADGRLMLAAAVSQGKGAVGLWDVASGKLVRTFEYPGVTIAALSPDGRSVAIGLEEAKDNLAVVDASTGERRRVLTNGIAVTRLAFAPDSRHVLTGSRDNIARIVDIETGESRELIGHTNIIWGTAFSADGRWALTGSQDRTARLWDVATATEVRRFASHQYSAIGGVAFSPDGRTIAIGNFDGYTQLAPSDLKTLVDSTCARLLRDFLPSERVIYEIPDDRPTCDATTSISTSAPFGSAATPTVERAGGGSVTNRP